MIALHKNAATTPAIRRKIAQSDEPVALLATRYSVSEDTVRRWKKRDRFEDRSHTAHRLQTTLTPDQEIVVVELRRMLLLPLDDLLAITREFLNPDVSRSGLSRCLRRHEVGNLNALKPKVVQTHDPANPLYYNQQSLVPYKTLYKPVLDGDINKTNDRETLSPIIPMGFGVKYNLTKNLGMCVELCIRKTFTD